MSDFKDFLLWENTTRDTIDFKKIYVDMAGDVMAGLLLSQIVFWHLPDDEGKSKLRVHKKTGYWLAKNYGEWYDEIRFTHRQARYALSKLEKANLIETKVYKFNGAPTKHIRINPRPFLQSWQKHLKPQKPQNCTNSGSDNIVKSKCQDCQMEHADFVNSLTEITTEIKDSSSTPDVSETSTPENPGKQQTVCKSKTKDSTNTSKRLSSSTKPGQDTPEPQKPDKYEDWGFGSLHTQFQHMRKNGAASPELTGIVYAMLNRLGVSMTKKDGTPNFSVAGKVRKLGDKRSAELLWKMWQMKRDGVLTSPNGYLHSVLGGA